MKTKKGTTLRLIKDVIGQERTSALCSAFGGTRFHFPVRGESKSKNFMRLANVIGVDAANVLCSHFSDEDLYIPLDKEAQQKERNQRIHTAFDRGMGIAELARQFALSDRHISNILKIGY